MHTQTDKTPVNQGRAVANMPVQKQEEQQQADEVVNNHTRAIAQRKLQKAVNNSSRVQQLKAYQAMADSFVSKEPAQRKESMIEESSNVELSSSQKEGTKPPGSAVSNAPVQKQPDNTGMPNNLKSGIENLSGYSMDDVKVHYNSAQPEQLQAHAYAQGTDIHIAPGQEQHLPHEAWHVVQQKQGRVKATMQMKSGVGVNDDKSLEHEADVMGRKAQTQDLKPLPDGPATQLSVDRMATQLRSKNPSRQDTNEYKKPGPVKADESTDMTEHHIVPHARLELLKRKMGFVNAADFMPTWDNVTVRMMTNLKSGWQESWVKAAKLDMDGLAKDNMAKLIQWSIEEKQNEPEAFTMINRSKNSWAESFKGGSEPDKDWAGAFFEWLPGNIVKGPTERPHDQGDGDNLDKELVFLLKQMGQNAHAEKAEQADREAIEFTSGNKKPQPEAIEKIKKTFQELNAFGYTEYTEEQRKHWEVYKDGFQVKGYGGNS